MLRQHIGDWLALSARAERDPFHISVRFSLGELPTAWSSARPRRAPSWTAVVGLILVVPFATLLLAGLLTRIGFNSPLLWIGSTNATIIAVTLSVLLGIPIAIVMNFWRVALAGLRRRHGELEGVVALEFAPFHWFVVVLAVIVGAVLVGHLAAGAYEIFISR